MSVGLDPASNEFLGRMLAHSASVMIWISDTEKQCVFFNRSWLAFRGATLEQESGFGWAKAVHPDDYNECLNIYVSHFDLREPFCMDYRMLRYDGEYRWIRDEGAPYFDEQNVFKGYIGSCFDITDQKELQSRLIQAEKMDALGKLSSSLAHDLNNKLAGISGFAELIEQKTHEEGVLRLVEKIRSICEKTAHTTTQLLKFSRKKLTVSKVFDVVEIVKQTVDLVESSLDARYTITAVLGEQAIIVDGEAEAIQNVVLNLLVNARDAMPDGGKIRVVLNETVVSHTLIPELKAGCYAVISVSDSGTGIADEIKDKIFEPFFTTKKDGNGFGLASSYATVKQHKGVILVDSSLARGSKFEVFLPIAVDKT